MRRLLAVLLVLIGLALLFFTGRGLWLTRYRQVTSDSYLWGAFHVHSTFSDGLAPLDEIAEEAREARVSFVLLSDHGTPHPDAALVKETIDGVRFIGGSEVGLPEGHLIVSDADTLPRYKLPPYPPDAVEDVRAWGGFSVLTYPEDPVTQWRYWGDDFVPDGIEIVNVTSYFRASSARDKISWAFYSLFNRNFFITALEPPSYALRRWDELLERGRVFAVYAANAHGGFPVTERWRVGIPSYATAMGFVGLGVDRRFASAPEEAIRRGEFFAIVRGAGEPERFELSREGESVHVVLEVEELTPRIVLKKDGAVVAEPEPGRLEIAYPASEPGVYRAEVYLEDHPFLDPGVPWILSNPLYVGVDYPPVGPAPLVCDSIAPLPLSELHIETDDESTATIHADRELSYHLARASEDAVNRWVALALRKPMDLSPYRGIAITAASPETMRYWLELRAGDREYYASFKIPGGKIPADDDHDLVVPWGHFYRALDGRETPPLAEIDALFISVNTSNARTGFDGRLKLTRLGLCR